MRQHTKLRFVGSLGLMIATSAGLSTAQGQDNPRAAGAAGHSTELLITHALDMALEGSELQLTIRQAGGPVLAGKTDGGVARTSETDGPGAAKAGGKHGGMVQLQHQVRRSFQESYELMKASNRLLRGGAEAREREERAPASRLYAAANLYANTLYSLGRQTFGWQAGWDPADRSTPDRTGEDKEPGTTHEVGPKLTTADLASITLINHSVKESVSAFELKRSLHHRMAGDAASKLLHDHADAMAKESKKSVEQILASLHERAAAGTPEPKPDNEAAAPGAHEGWSGTQVQALAQQAREVIRVLDELGSETGGAPGARRGER